MLSDVPKAFDAIERKGRILRVNRRGFEFPKGGHFQGIQLLPGNPDRLHITSSSKSRAYLVTCRLDAECGSGRVERITDLAAGSLDHPGGFQAAGRILAIGVEDNDRRTRSEVQFWQTRGSLCPTMLSAKTIQRSGVANRATAGAVGIAAGADRTVLVVGAWDSKVITFYTAAPDVFKNPSRRFRKLRTWRLSRANKSGWIDRNFGDYQALNLICQTDGCLFMVAFNRSRGRDFMDLYTVHLHRSTPDSQILRKIAKKHMTCKAGASFNAAAGVFVRSRDCFDVWAAKGTSGDHKTGTTITLNRFMGHDVSMVPVVT